MKTAVLVALCLALAVAVYAQENAGINWQGTWNDGKRNLGGSLYICISDNGEAYGTYSNAGFLSGFLDGNTFRGFWYEAGYHNPFGTFSLTLSGNSFGGSWSYYDGKGVQSAPVSWTGSRSSSSAPSFAQCGNPSKSAGATGFYADGSAVCATGNNNDLYDTTPFPAAAAQFAVSTSQFGNFPGLRGYTPDNGRTILLSDYSTDDDGTLRPEDAGRNFGPVADYPPADLADDAYDNDDQLDTGNIAVGRFISGDQLCVTFWKGLYNVNLGTECIGRISSSSPDQTTCLGKPKTFNPKTDLKGYFYDILYTIFNDNKDNFFPEIVVDLAPVPSPTPFPSLIHTTVITSSSDASTLVASLLGVMFAVALFL